MKERLEHTEFNRGECARTAALNTIIVLIMLDCVTMCHKMTNELQATADYRGPAVCVKSGKETNPTEDYTQLN